VTELVALQKGQNLISYAQNFEDVMLARVFHNRQALYARMPVSTIQIEFQVSTLQGGARGGGQKLFAPPFSDRCDNDSMALEWNDITGNEDTHLGSLEPA
jgi:hypothetical protein